MYNIRLRIQANTANIRFLLLNYWILTVFYKYFELKLYSLFLFLFLLHWNRTGSLVTNMFLVRHTRHCGPCGRAAGLYTYCYLRFSFNQLEVDT